MKSQKKTLGLLTGAAIIASMAVNFCIPAAAQEPLTVPDSKIITQTPAEAPTAEDGTGAPAAAENGTGAPAAAENDFPAPGSSRYGFTLDSSEYSSLLDADIQTFTHEKSGARLVYVKNSDPEMAFSISFRAPLIDETDTNHVFEHAILASSEKYPSKDIYYDLNNKGYMTYVNAATYPVMTTYPISSVSEEQLLLAMDVYMSCMEKPSILTDENFYKREAIRLELDSPEEEIALKGTVFSEDLDNLTDLGKVSYDQTLDLLYPGEYNSNTTGKGLFHYQDLTYEQTLETYERYYHYDNCLIYLYGDLELPRFLSFLDTEYLSRQDRYGTDLSAFRDPLTEAGYEEADLKVPAHEGDDAENSGILTYALDLQDVEEREVHAWNIIAVLLNNNASPMYRILRERGIQNQVFCSVDTATAKPFLQFNMYYANADQKEDLKAVVMDTLKQVAEEGLDPRLLEGILKQQKLITVLQRDAANVGVTVSSAISLYWARTGQTDIFQLTETVLDELSADTEQKEIRRLARKMQTPRRSVLLSSIPAPGLAEDYEEEKAQYLKDLKASLSEDEIAQLIQETKDFREWNLKEIPNNDFLIDPADLPEYKEPGSFVVSEQNGVTVYTGTADVENAGRYRIYFDLSGMTREDIEYLMLYQQLLFMLDTDQYTGSELQNLASEYLHGISFSLCYPNADCGENHRPMLIAEWSSLTGDFKAGLDLLLNVLTKTDVSRHDLMAFLLWSSSEGWDMSKQDGGSIAYNAALSGAGLQASSKMFDLDADGQDMYRLITEIIQGLSQDDAYPSRLQERFEYVRSLAFTNSRPVFMSVADVSDNPSITKTAVERLSSLPAKPETGQSYSLPVPARKTGICIESTLNATYLIADFLKDPEFRGSYLPFMFAANDKYTIPVLRFQSGAYTAGSTIGINTCVLMSYSVSDPNVGSTIQIMEELPENLKNLELTEEEIKGYILKTYGIVTFPRGAWSSVMNRMSQSFMGLDFNRYREIIHDIKNSEVSLLEEAAEHIGQVMENACIVTTGNETLIREDADAFEEVVSYRNVTE